MKRFLVRYGIATWLAAIHAACGVYMGEPIRLFKTKNPDGGIPASEACDLASTQISGNTPSTVGPTGAELYDLAARPFTAPLTWTRGGGTSLRITLGDIKVYSVDATRNIEYDRWSQTDACEDHALIEAALTLQTDDGRLNEQTQIKFVAYDDFEAHGSFVIEKDALVGSFQTSASGNECFQRLHVRLLIARDGPSGTIGEDIEGGACDDPTERPVEEYAVAKWGKRAYNYGD